MGVEVAGRKWERPELLDIRKARALLQCWSIVFAIIIARSEYCDDNSTAMRAK